MKRIIARVLAVSLALLLLSVGLGWLFFRPLVFRLMQPSGSFAAASPPAPADYSQPASWSALPELKDAADAALPELAPIDPRVASADVFYVHPTTYIGSRWNGPIDDARLNADTDRVATRIQASAFSGCCAVYAPRYRQASGWAFPRPSADGDRALDLATSDIERAFESFQQRRGVAGKTRPFIVAAHSQGSILAYRLLKQQISGRPLRKDLVAAYLIGGLIPQDAVAKELPDIPVCAAPDQTGCLISWNARGPAYRENDFEMDTTQYVGVDRHALRKSRVCVNPLSWTRDARFVAADHNRGALFFDAPSPRILPAFASAQCQDGTLVVATIGEVPRDFMSRLLDHALGAQNYHPVEYQIFFLPLRENASTRLAAFLKRQPQAPAPL